MNRYAGPLTLSTTLTVMVVVILILPWATGLGRAPVAVDATDAAYRTDHGDTFFHYSIWWAFVNKVFDGDLTVKDLKANGDVGLGSFDFLDGEMIMVDGVPYRITEDGKVSIGADEDQIVYANAAFFDADKQFEMPGPNDYDAFRQRLNPALPSLNYFYAFKVHGNFKKMKCGGLNKQSKPFKDGLDVLIPNRPVFEQENVSGTMIGFFCPEFIGNINVAGYHFHFISDDRKMGGHVMEFLCETPLEVELDRMKDYHFVLPENEDYENVELKKEFQYKKK